MKSKRIPRFKSIKRARLFFRRAHLRTVVLTIGSLFLALLLVGIIVFLLAQDISAKETIFQGITIAGCPVGGLSQKEAVELVSEKVAKPIVEPITIKKGDFQMVVQPEELELRVDVEKMVKDAIMLGRKRSMPERMFKRFLGMEIKEDVPLSLSYNKSKLEKITDRLSKRINKAPVSASIDISTGSPKIKPSSEGIKVKEEELKKRVTGSFTSKNKTVEIPTEVIPPKITTEDIRYIIVIKQSEHKLYLYFRENLEGTHIVAVGSPQYPTPNGKFYIREKEKDPWWNPPQSDWAKGLKPVPPGPGNPLGRYWMGIGNAIGIHATPDEASLGYSVSHGCIRMSEWGAKDLFEKVKVGTPVFIFP